MGCCLAGVTAPTKLPCVTSYGVAGSMDGATVLHAVAEDVKVLPLG